MWIPTAAILTPEESYIGRIVAGFTIIGPVGAGLSACFILPLLPIFDPFSQGV